MDRKYTVGEIDRMRALIRWSYPCEVPFYETARAKDIEERLRTYMLNGTTVDELEEMRRAASKREQEIQLARQQHEALKRPPR